MLPYDYHLKILLFGAQKEPSSRSSLLLQRWIITIKVKSNNWQQILALKGIKEGIESMMQMAF